MDKRDLWFGLRVVWHHVPRGGYGYVVKIPATIRKVSAERVTIELDRPLGKLVTVSPASLRPVNQHAVDLSAFGRGE